MRKAVVIQVAALGQELLRANGTDELCGLPVQCANTVFPAVTCTVQATFRTAAPASLHGMVGNGFLCRDLMRALFWEQSATLVSGKRIWECYRKKGGRVAMLFWQQSLGEAVDMMLSPAPIHKHHGGMIQDCYSQPHSLYAEVTGALGRPFNLMHYWGPFASAKSSQWIAEATAQVLERDDAPDLCFTYLPVLDYDLQRFGPDHPRASRALDALLGQLDLVVTAARRRGYEILLFGDYAIEPCTAAVFPNRALLDAGLMQCRPVRRMHYPDLYASRAFAVVDHQVAHVHVRRSPDIDIVRKCLLGLDGVAHVLDREQQAEPGINHPRSGELVAICEPGRWMAYPWWTERRQEPEYAGHVDIHNKPGYDPVELFSGALPWQISRDTTRIRGSHGRVGDELKIAWASSMIDGTPANLIELSGTFADWLAG
jgi:predicted AlkP superfamily pyrophosphatase or phosphodiesterase